MQGVAGRTSCGVIWNDKGSSWTRLDPQNKTFQPCPSVPKRRCSPSASSGMATGRSGSCASLAEEGLQLTNGGSPADQAGERHQAEEVLGLSARQATAQHQAGTSRSRSSSQPPYLGGIVGQADLMPRCPHFAPTRPRPWLPQGQEGLGAEVGAASNQPPAP